MEPPSLRSNPSLQIKKLMKGKYHYIFSFKLYSDHSNWSLFQLCSTETRYASFKTVKRRNYKLQKITVIQAAHFESDLRSPQRKLSSSKSSSLLSLQLFVDDSDVLRVGGRQRLSQTSNYQSMHPAILHGKHPLTHLMICVKHLHLLHAGSTLLTASLSRHYHIVCERKMIRSVMCHMSQIHCKA